MDFNEFLRTMGSGILSLTRWIGRRMQAQMVHAVGGAARARVIFLFGAVLALASADAATIGAVAGELQPALHIDNTEVGLLNSVTLLAGALAVLPVGFLVDRVNRIKMLAFSIFLWSVASFWSGLVGSYGNLLLARVALGAVTATAGPAIASLTGDYFPARERGHVYGYILGGEVAGTAVGFIISGSISAALSWRFAFFAIAIPGFFLARMLLRTVPEPKRGGASRLEPGALHLFEEHGQPADPDLEDPDVREDELAHQKVQEHGIEPDPELVLDEDPNTMTLKRAVRYVLRIPTNVTLIVSSALGYFFLAGLSTFAVVFVRGHYHVSQATATLVLGLLVIGSLIGVLVSGRLTDWMLRRGYLTARMWVPGVCYLAAAVLLIPGLLGNRLFPAAWFDIAGAALISAANPPLDAGRLDIIVSGLWGRAESVRTLLRTVAQAIAPLLFGAIADLVAGFTPSQAPIGTKTGGVSQATARGLEVSFLVMLIPLAAAGYILLRGRHEYPRDVAAAAASEARVRQRAAPTAEVGTPTRRSYTPQGADRGARGGGDPPV
ncbi:MAG TPA: MFS transporter [Thermoleophilaceae bacterium]|nr:MFS transporter [Thermoleophilaceae bacterium]